MDRESPPKLFVATKAIIFCGGKYLLLRESGTYEDGTNAGRYDVPGGRLVPGEVIEESLRREVREETGLDVSVHQPVACREWRPVVRGEQWQVVGIFYVCKTPLAEVKLGCDHDSAVWVSPQDFSQYPVIDNLRPVLEFVASEAVHLNA